MDRYEEALERAKQGLPIDEVFPELKESEDERIRKVLLNYHKNAPEQYTCGGLTNAEVVAWLEKQKEQKPAEWGEEDEKNIEKLDGFLSEVFCYGHVYVSQKEKEELQNWLKSLRPQPHWKPSEVQMEALKYALGNGGAFDKDALKSLYNDINTTIPIFRI